MARELTQAEREKALQWIERNWLRDKGCPICGSSKWVVMPHLVGLAVTDPDGNVSLGSTSYPMVTLVSDPCGYTLQFNAVVMGLVKPGGTND